MKFRGSVSRNERYQHSHAYNDFPRFHQFNLCAIGMSLFGSFNSATGQAQSHAGAFSRLTYWKHMMTINLLNQRIHWHSKPNSKIKKNESTWFSFRNYVDALFLVIYCDTEFALYMYLHLYQFNVLLSVCQPAHTSCLVNVSLCDAHGASVCGFMLGWSRRRFDGGTRKWSMIKIFTQDWNATDHCGMSIWWPCWDGRI